jgi:hypothetical protein
MFNWLNKSNIKSNTKTLEIGSTSASLLSKKSRNYGSMDVYTNSLFPIIKTMSRQELKQKRFYTTQLDEFCFAVADHLADAWDLKISKKFNSQVKDDEEQREAIIAESALIIKKSMVVNCDETELNKAFKGMQVDALDFNSYCNTVEELSGVDGFKKPISAYDLTYIQTLKSRLNLLNLNANTDDVKTNHLESALYSLLNDYNRKQENSSP